jgi:hypothetical protein
VTPGLVLTAFDTASVTGCWTFLIAALFVGESGLGATIDAVNDPPSLPDVPDGCAGLLLLHATAAAIIAATTHVRIVR